MHFKNAFKFFFFPNNLEQQSPPRQKSVQNDQSNDLNPDTTCLYIGNIDKNVDNGKLTDLFKKFGQLEYCFLVYEPSSSDRNRQVKISRGYGFVKFIKIEDLMTAKNQLDGFELNGRKIKIELSKRNKPRESTPGRYLGKKRDSPPRKGYRHRGRSYSRSSSESYHRRRNYDRKQKQQKPRRHHELSRSRDRGDNSRKRKRSSSYDRQPRRKD